MKKSALILMLAGILTAACNLPEAGVFDPHKLSPVTFGLAVGYAF